VPRISVVVPTYRRERVLVETLEQLLRQLEPTDELLVIDQTEQHDPATGERLQQLQAEQAIRWIQQQPPSITAAMNCGLLEARCDVVLFVDDDIVPEALLLLVHRKAHATHSKTVVAGRVIQPWDVVVGSSNRTDSIFTGVEPAWIDEFMGGNFSVRRDQALELGGFDENFVQVAYRYEAEFANRFRAAGGRIRFEPLACLHHLHAAGGGTRSYGEHLTTMKPAHAVGAYYFSLRTQSRGRWLRECLTRPLRAIATRHHLREPWWIPVTLFSELRGMWWAIRLHYAGPRLIGTTRHVS
jgi:GT2 family glycosyltransferase